jgi:anti-sigma regulatory factor (Ser/Thr protein kinase)
LRPTAASRSSVPDVGAWSVHDLLSSPTPSAQAREVVLCDRGRDRYAATFTERHHMSVPAIRIVIPAETRFVAFARVTAATVGAELDFTLDDIEELRMAANELVATVVEWARDHSVADVELEYRLGTETLELAARAKRDGAGNPTAHEIDALTRSILEAIVDDFEIGEGYGRITKSRTAL